MLDIHCLDVENLGGALRVVEIAFFYYRAPRLRLCGSASEARVAPPPP